MQDSGLRPQNKGEKNEQKINLGKSVAHLKAEGFWVMSNSWPPFNVDFGIGSGNLSVVISPQDSPVREEI